MRLSDLIGKKISDCFYPDTSCKDSIVIKFTDGTSVTVESDSYNYGFPRFCIETEKEIKTLTKVKEPLT